MSELLTDSEIALLVRDASLMTSSTAQLMATAVGWGIYSLVFALSVHLLGKKGIRDSPPRQILLVSTCLMFTLSTALIIVDAAILVVQFTDVNNKANVGSTFDDLVSATLPTVNGLQLACEVLFDTLFLLGDTIVIWRTWMLWRERRVIVVLPMFIWFGSFCCLLSLLGISIHNGQISNWTVGVYDAKTTNDLSISISSLSAATNLVSTSLIAFKAWTYRELFRSNGSMVGPGTRSHKVMSLLVESGLIYLAIWVLGLLNFYLDWKAPHLQSALRGLYDMMLGLYPTVIIVLVLSGNTIWDASSSYSSSANTRNGAVLSSSPFTSLPPMVASRQTQQTKLNFEQSQRDKYSTYSPPSTAQSHHPYSGR